jgi:hypothetical protein
LVAGGMVCPSNFILAAKTGGFLKYVPSAAKMKLERQTNVFFS